MIQRGATFGAPFLLPMRAKLFSLLLLATLGLRAQFVLSPEINKAQDLIMDLRFEEAKVQLQKAAETNPKNGMIPCLQANMLFLQTFINGNPADYEAAVDSLVTLIERVEDNKEDDSPMCRYVLAEMHFELGATHMLFGSNWSSAWAVLDAFDYIKANRMAPADFLPQYMASGVLNVAMGSLPGKYKFLASIMGYSGDVEVGLKELKRATKVSGTPYASFRKKSAFIYTYIYFFLRPEKTFNVWDVITGYEESPLLVYSQAKIYHERCENEPLIKLLSGRPKAKRVPFYYLDYMLGKAKLNRLDPDADAPLLYFLSTYPGQNNVKAAKRYLSWHYYLRGNNKLSNQYKKESKAISQNIVGADKQADLDINRPYEIHLLKAQLYFDGGYYQRALDALADGVEAFELPNEKIEFYYRLGRIYQQTEEYQQAIQSYNRLFLYAESNNTYQAANAALQIALIYEKALKYEDAKIFFKKALGHSGFPFEDGIQQKAKAGINRIKD